MIRSRRWQQALLWESADRGSLVSTLVGDVVELVHQRLLERHLLVGMVHGPDWRSHRVTLFRSRDTLWKPVLERDNYDNRISDLWRGNPYTLHQERCENLFTSLGGLGETPILPPKFRRAMVADIHGELMIFYTGYCRASTLLDLGTKKSYKVDRAIVGAARDGDGHVLLTYSLLPCPNVRLVSGDDPRPLRSFTGYHRGLFCSTPSLPVALLLQTFPLGSIDLFDPRGAAPVASPMPDCANLSRDGDRLLSCHRHSASSFDWRAWKWCPFFSLPAEQNFDRRCLRECML